MKMKLIFLMGLTFWCFLANAQTADQEYKRPLVEVLETLKARYQVEIKYDKRIIADWELKYADWRLIPGDFKQSLTNVLAPFDYTFVEQEAGIYKIKPFQYHLITPEAGAASLEYLKTLYDDLQSWKERKALLSSCIYSALELDKLPVVTSPKVMLGKVRKYNGYTVQNVALETVPGLYATGSVFRPVKARGKIPVIISPNGHFGDGRYNRDIQVRCAALARMGAIVVSYDLFGWGESALQVSSTSHRKSIAHTIQTKNGLSFMDYLLKDPQADASRVGITGGSGGGSQTMLLAALDKRITVSVPTVMTSSFHSGGCPCESGMPIHLCGERTNNAELAALLAPNPQLIISDGKDWTFQVPEVEFPFIQRTYGFYDAVGQVENAHFPDEGHDYGLSKRTAMYAFMAKKLGLDLKAIQNNAGVIDESFVTIESEDQLKIWGKDGGGMPLDAIRSLEELYQKLGKESDE